MLNDQLDEYQKILEEAHDDTIIYVVFYDISNHTFLSPEVQQKFASLLSLPKLRVIASIENCKIVMCWSLSKLFYKFRYDRKVQLYLRKLQYDLVPHHKDVEVLTVASLKNAKDINTNQSDLEESEQKSTSNCKYLRRELTE